MKWLCSLLGHRWATKSVFGSGQARCIACSRCGHEQKLIPLVRA